MKKIFTLCLVAVAAMFAGNAFAQDDTEMTILVGSTDNKAEIPVTVYLTNPTVAITAVEANIEAPVNVNKFVYDEEEEDYKTADTDRWGKKHTVKYAAGTAAHGANVFFISILHHQPRQQGLQGDRGCRCYRLLRRQRAGRR